MELVEILQAAVERGASDVHLTVGCPPLLRADGNIIEIEGAEPLTTETCKAYVFSVLYDEQRARFEQDLELDTAVNLRGLARFRVNVLQQRGNVEAVFRVIPVEIPSPAFLGLGPGTMSLAELPRGLVLVTGPTGSGKSSTMACMIEHINQRFTRHIVTIEDPIEYIYSRKKSVIRQRELGRDTRSFAQALRHALRQDPDVLLIGEMRDLETISLALTAAETGHLVLATLHTSEADQAMDRIVDVFPAERHRQIRVQLANSLKGVLSQILLPRRDGRGRVAARGLLKVSAAISNLIREGNSHQIRSVIQTSGGQGMFTVDTSLRELVRRGIVDENDAAAKAFDSESVFYGNEGAPLMGAKKRPWAVSTGAPR